MNNSKVIRQGFIKFNFLNFIKFGGYLLVVMGLVVIFGWYTHLEILMRTLPNQVPMQFNTAILFILCGLSLLFHLHNKPRLEIICASLVLIFSLLSLTQYLFGLDFSIDRLFFNPYIITGVQKPGRMAPNTALSFAFASLALVIQGWTLRKASRWYYLGLVILGALTTALGTVAALGYLTGISTAYGWGQQTRMAINTTLGMITLGLSIVACTFYKVQNINKLLPRWLPLLIFIAGIIVTISLWQALLAEEGLQLDQATALATKTLQVDLSDGIESRLLLLNRIARRWENTSDLQQTDWERDVALEAQDFGGVQAIALTGPALNITRVGPLQGNESLLNQSFPVNATTRSALMSATKPEQFVVSPILNDAAQPGNTTGFVAFIPLFKDGIKAGYLSGIFQNQALISNILSHASLSQYRLTITSNGQTIFLQESSDGPPVSTTPQQMPISFNGINWQILLEPNSQAQKAQQSWLPAITLFVGVLISALLASVTSLALTSRRRAKGIERTNLELLRSEKLYRTLANNLPESAVLLFDKDMRFTLAEGPALVTQGLHKLEIEGRTIPEIFSGEWAEPMVEAFRQALTGIPSAFEQVFQKAIFQVQVLPVKNEDGQIFSGMFVSQDITERKRNELVKKDFISTVSHELRTPLTSIQGSLGLVVGGITGPLSGPTQTMLDIAYKNCTRLIRLINDILDIEKIESGKMISHKKPVELTSIIEQAMEANRAYGGQFDVTFHRPIQESQLRVMVNADSDQLMQVLNNLLSNAAKYSPLGGTVEIEVSVLKQKVRVSITDQGKGIPEEFQSRIFQKFSQADSSDTRQKGGTGLGLSIVKALMIQNDGQVGFESASGKGTCFFFELPVFLLENSVEPPSTPDAQDRANILIVEDNQETASLISASLEKAGFNTEMAPDIQQARDWLAKKDFAGMTLDLFLPDQDGISFAKELGAVEATQFLPIIVVSNIADKEREALEGSVYPIVDWLQKPFDTKRLVSSTRKAVRTSIFNNNRSRILHVEDDTDLAQVVSLVLKEVARVDNVTNLVAAKKSLDQVNYDMVILDIALPDGTGLDLLAYLKEGGNAAVPIIIFSAQEYIMDVSIKVEAALLKSRTSNQDLVRIIKTVLLN